jgi:methyl-accepting chemotaxis protein
MPSVQYIAKTILNPRDAIASLVRWKITLLTAAQMREPLSERAINSIQHPDQCSIGQWLFSVHTLPLRGTPEYRAVVDRHNDFHHEMQTIARLINTADYAAAERLLNAPIGFQHASMAVANAIMALDRVPIVGPPLKLSL